MDLPARARLLLEYERSNRPFFTASCVVTESEAELFRRLIPGRKVSVVANGVELERFSEKPGDRSRTSWPSWG